MLCITNTYTCILFLLCYVSYYYIVIQYFYRITVMRLSLRAESEVQLLLRLVKYICVCMYIMYILCVMLVRYSVLYDIHLTVYNI